MDASIDLYAEEYANDYAEISDDNLEQEVADIEHVEPIDNEEEHQETESKDNNEEESKKVKPKRVIKNPRPKLDIQSLKGHKGLLCLESYFKSKKFRGKGHEEEDLRVIMKTYEYWCHRLFPKFSFDDCLGKLEKLGTKKNVQVYLKKLRMDLIFDEDQPIRSDHEGELLNDASIPQFDDLFPPKESTEVQELPTLTEEQLERIHANKEKANRLRQEKLQINNKDIIEKSCEDSNELTNVGNEDDSEMQSQLIVSQNHNDECTSEDTNTHIDCE